MTRSSHRQGIILVASLVAALMIVAFALGQHPTGGSAAGPRKSTETQLAQAFDMERSEREAQVPTSSSKLATTTVYVPLVQRNWEFVRDYEVVWGTQFGVEESETAYEQLMEHELPLAQEAGFTSVRTHLYWREVEPTNTIPENYDWSKYDRHLRDFRSFGLDPIVTIVAYPLWASQYYCGGGLRPGMEVEWREFVHALAQRYSEPPYNVHTWEIGNEVDGETEVDPEDSERPPEQGGNQPTWHFGGCWGDMAPEYVDFLRAAHEEIKAVDPVATVTHGGLAYAVFDQWFIRDFFENFLAAGGAEYTDVVGFHWFPYRQPWPTAGDKAAELLSTMATYDVSKPLWLTETYMWDREGETDTRDLRVDFITHMLPRTMSSQGIERIYWFGFRDFRPELSTFDRGLVTWDHQPKPGLKVFEIMASFVNGHPRPTPALPPEVEAHRFIQPDKHQETWTLWSTTDENQTVTLPILSPPLEAVTIQVGDTYTTTKAISTTVTMEDGNVILPVGPKTLLLRLEK